MSRSLPGAWSLLALAFSAGPALAQEPPPSYVELRAADSDSGFYRYLEYSRTFGRGPVIDIVYFGLPGQNEFYLGAGYPLRVTPTLTVTPLLYGVFGKENGERGVALGTFVLGTVRDWSIYSFWGYFEPISGSVPRYVFLDSLDLSRRLGRWELGGSAGLFHAAGQWSYLVGWVLIRNDRWGAWRAYLRGGSSLEVRLGRTLSF